MFSAFTWSRFHNLWTLNCNEYHNYGSELPETRTKFALWIRQQRQTEEHYKQLVAVDKAIWEEEEKQVKEEMDYLAAPRPLLVPLSPQHTCQQFECLLGLRAGTLLQPSMVKAGSQSSTASDDRPTTMTSPLQTPLCTGMFLKHTHQCTCQLQVHLPVYAEVGDLEVVETLGLYAVHAGGRNCVFNNHERAMEVLQQTPDGELVFVGDKWRLWELLDKDGWSIENEMLRYKRQKVLTHNCITGSSQKDEYEKGDVRVPVDDEELSVFCSKFKGSFKASAALEVLDGILKGGHPLSSWLGSMGTETGTSPQGDRRLLRRKRNEQKEMVFGGSNKRQPSNPELINKAFEDRMKLIAKIAKDFEKLEHVICAILSSQACTAPSSTITGNHIRMMHCGAKTRVIRATSKVAQLDVRLTAAKVGDAIMNLYQSTGIHVFAVFSHSNSDDLTLPYYVDSDNTLNFFLQVFNHNSFALMRKFKQWSCIQGNGHVLSPDEQNDLAGACSKVSHMFLDGLRYITNKATIKMEYVKYDLAIHKIYGVRVVGLPSYIELLRASFWNLETVRRVHVGLKDGSVCWVKMMKTEHEVLIAKYNTLHADSVSGSLKQCATRSDKDTRHKKTVEKEGMGGRSDALPLTTATPVDLTPTPVNPMPAPVDSTPAPVDLTPVSVNPTPAPVDLSMAFNMHLDPAILKEPLRIPPYKGPLILLDLNNVNSDVHLFNIPQGLPAPITDHLPILPCPKFSLPTSPVLSPNVSLDSIRNLLEGLGTHPPATPAVLSIVTGTTTMGAAAVLHWQRSASTTDKGAQDVHDKGVRCEIEWEFESDACVKGSGRHRELDGADGGHTANGTTSVMAITSKITVPDLLSYLPIVHHIYELSLPWDITYLSRGNYHALTPLNPFKQALVAGWKKEMLKVALCEEEFLSAQELIECSCGWWHKFRLE
ncbi:hypothetical protein B0H14DRAFT_2631812 [Mycena olivaceomarginata]|nr:hypothetical protein B0H14DRAFT_2631812 [Mycena olivaceomarginata]